MDTLAAARLSKQDAALAESMIDDSGNQVFPGESGPPPAGLEIGQLAEWMDVAVAKAKASATSSATPLPDEDADRRELERLQDRFRRLGPLGPGVVIVGVETHRPDGSVDRIEQATTLDALRKEHARNRRPVPLRATTNENGALTTRAVHSIAKREPRRASSGRKRASSSRSSDSDPPSARHCRGCGGSLDGYPGQRRWCDHCQRARNCEKVAAHYARHHPHPAEVAPPAAAKLRPGYIRRVRDEINDLSSERLAIWIELPGANGNRDELRAQVARLTHELEDQWNELRLQVVR